MCCAPATCFFLFFFFFLGIIAHGALYVSALWRTQVPSHACLYIWLLLPADKFASTGNDCASLLIVSPYIYNCRKTLMRAARGAAAAQRRSCAA